MSRSQQPPGAFRGPGSLGQPGGRSTPSRGATVHRQGKLLKTQSPNKRTSLTPYPPEESDQGYLGWEV